MEQLAFVSKSSEKSSPSFPEDVEDDEEEPLELDPPDLKCNSEGGATTTATTSTAGEVVVSDSNPTDVTMLAEDEDDDDLEEVGGGDGGVCGPRGDDGDAGGATAVGCDLARSFTLNSVDSPRHPTDSSEKKVHWSNHHVQTLLDCVEKHLDEFNIQKKHKQVWQTIGGEMESFGFTMEHCYNKWKNLRRDVRLLVNNPQKVVRNADILRRVARLILVIHPNIDATTMQVTGTGCASLLGDRNGRSAPNTPGGGLSSRGFVSSSLHGPNSPRYPVNSSSTTNTPNSHLYHHHHHHLASGFRHTPNGSSAITGDDLKSLKREGHEQAPPSTALFINLGPECDAQPEHNQPQQSQQALANHHQHLLGQSQSSQQQQQQQQQQHSLLASVVSDVAAAAVAAAASVSTTGSDEAMTTTTTTSFPFFFSPAAAALLVQSQLFNDLIRQQQQQQQQGDEHMPLVSSETVVTSAHAAASTPKPATVTNGSICHQHSLHPQPMQFELQQQQQQQPRQPTPDVVTLATTLLNGLSSVAAAASAAATSEQQQQLPGIAQAHLVPSILSTAANACSSGSSSNSGSLLLGCHLPPGTELAGVVERLRDEETVHLRLTDCVSHLANELRAAGLRRRQALDQLLLFLQTARLHQTVAPAVAAASSLVTSTKQTAATSAPPPVITKQASSHD